MDTNENNEMKDMMFGSLNNSNNERAKMERNYREKQFNNINNFNQNNDIKNEFKRRNDFGRRNKKNKKIDFKKIGLLIVILLIIICTIMYINFNNNLKPVNSNDPKEKRFTISKSQNGNTFIEYLQKEGLIKNVNAFKIKYKLSGSPKFQEGRYKISTAKSVEEIINILKNGEVDKNEVTIRLIEGKTFTDLAEIISKNTKNTKEDVINVGKDKEYIKSLKKDFWFINDEMLNRNIYYPLEGYLFPDTYYVDKESDVKSIFKTMLKQTESKLKLYKKEIEAKSNSRLTVHQMLTLASVIELEAPKGSDREKVATIFMNRLYKKMSLGSDVTTYYAFQVKMADRDLRIKEINTENPYNTRGPNMQGKLPIGPICMPSEDSIKSATDVAFNYKATDDIFFVSDKNGKIYATKSNEEHDKIIKELKSKGLWFVYK